MAWTSEYDQDTGEHRVYSSDGELVACVGNVSMSFAEQGAIASTIADMGFEIASQVASRLHTREQG